MGHLIPGTQQASIVLNLVRRSCRGDLYCCCSHCESSALEMIREEVLEAHWEGYQKNLAKSMRVKGIACRSIPSRVVLHPMQYLNYPRNQTAQLSISLKGYPLLPRNQESNRWVRLTAFYYSGASRG